MAEALLCPHCQRRLQLPDDYQAESARCPACKTTFPVASASRITSRSREVQRPTRSPWLIVAVLVGSLLLMLGACLVILGIIYWPTRSPQMDPAMEMEDPDEAQRELVRQTLKNRKPPTEEEIAKKVKPLLEELGAALCAGNPGRIMVKFDLARTADEVAAVDAGVLPRRDAKDRRDLRRRMAEGFAMFLIQRGDNFQWKETDLGEIEKLNNDEAIVLARHKHPNGKMFELRWWVTRRNGDWQIYDWENPDTARRMSAELPPFVAQGFGPILGGRERKR